MRPATDRRRLRRILALLFLALAIPTLLLTWQAYDQLKFEAFFQYQRQAESLATQIDSKLNDQMTELEARGFADFAFLNLADQSGNLLQRSPLATYPLDSRVPGVIGYFQVDAQGGFSTPLLPSPTLSAEELGIPVAELAARTALAGTIQKILTDNQLLRARVTTRPNVPATAPILNEAELSPNVRNTASAELSSTGNRSDTPSAAPEPPLAAIAEDTDSGAAYSQDAFDLLKRVRTPSEAIATDKEPAQAEAAAPLRDTGLGNLSDLELDDSLNRKSEFTVRRDAEEQRPATAQRQQESKSGPVRTRRVEQVALPDAEVLLNESLRSASTESRITTFESELDPFNFSLLGSGHGVLYRNVWRNGQRYIQGLLLDQERFVADNIASDYQASALSSMSDLLIASQGNVLTIVRGQAQSYPLDVGDLGGNLLHRSRLSAPLDDLQLVFSMNRLPAGAGGRVLTWTAVVTVLVFIAGFTALYRVGLSQIRLAQQQQDFVSAVSHELKTPLTSIRMYGEMLKEGWVEEDKRRQYYDYIHDESERLGRLISNVLRLAKITRNDPELDMRPLSVGEITSQIESKISGHVERANFELELSTAADSRELQLKIDMDCFTQIIINLVDNALKFSAHADTKRVVVKIAQETDGSIAFSVRDFGPGIPRQQMKKIFTLFYRSESELTRETLGTGIGLAIVHQLTQSMGGKIDVVNREPGAEFVVRFPTIQS